MSELESERKRAIYAYVDGIAIFVALVVPIAAGLSGKDILVMLGCMALLYASHIFAMEGYPIKELAKPFFTLGVWLWFFIWSYVLNIYDIGFKYLQLGIVVAIVLGFIYRLVKGARNA